MANYGCGGCNGTAFEVQMRKVLISIGPERELQAAGIVPARVCTNEECREATVASNLQIGDPVPLVPAAVPAPEEPEKPELRNPSEEHLAELLKLRETYEKLERETVAPAEKHAEEYLERAKDDKAS